MKRYILTGAPGAGKTIVLRRLELDGFAVVEEAATDLIALVAANGAERHWEQPTFVDDILGLQIARQRRADAWPVDTVVYDRSPVCTLALARFLGRAPSPALTAEIERLQRERVYERRVFFVEGLGFITPTEARQISLEDAARFADVHAATYLELGYELVRVAPGPVEARAEAVRSVIGAAVARPGENVGMRHSLQAQGGSHVAYAEGGDLVVEWYDFGESAPYESANLLVLDKDSQAVLAAAIGAPGASAEDLARLVAQRFMSWFAFRKFLGQNHIAAQQRTDFQP